MTPSVDAHRRGPLLALLVLLAVGASLPALSNYYFYDDGRLLREGARVHDEGWGVLLQNGFNGHFRPLLIASAFVIRSSVGYESPIPFHLLAIALHVANVLLAYLVLVRLDRNLRAAALLAAAVFAVHWAATEAVSYISALGVLWSALGGLIAVYAVLRWRSSRDVAAWAGILLGIAISLGGGEYGVGTLPLIGACAAWPDESDRPQWRRAVWILAAVVPIFLAYVVLSLTYNDRGRIGHLYRIGPHALRQLADNLSYLVLPTKWIRTLPCLLVLKLSLVLGAWTSAPFRQRLMSWRSWLLFAGALGTLVPYSFSLDGNYYRFVYAAAPFLSYWLFSLIETFIESIASSPAIARRPAVAVAVFFLVANVLNGYKRIASEGRRCDQVARFVHQTDRVIADHPDRDLRICVDRDIESAVDTIVALGRTTRDHCCQQYPPPATPNDVVWLVAHYDWGCPFEFEVLPAPSGTQRTAAAPTTAR